MAEPIFISYSKKDSEFAHKLADDLMFAGFKIWIDRSISGGDLWRETIEKNLKAAEEVIIIVSPNSMDSEWVKHEGSLAYGWEKQLFPILIEQVSSLPPWLEEYQWVDFVNAPYKKAFDALVETLTPPNPIQDLLEQQVQAYNQTGELIGNAILQVIGEARDTLKINDDAKALITLSQQAIEKRQQHEQQLVAGKEEAEKKRIAEQAIANKKLRRRAMYLTIAFVLALGALTFATFQASLNAELAQENGFIAQTAQAERERADQKAVEAQAESERADKEADEAIKQAEIATVRQLVTQANSLLENDLDLGLLLSIEANRILDNIETREVMFRGLQAHPNLEIFLHGYTDNVTNLSINEDKNEMISYSSDGSIKLWDISNIDIPVEMNDSMSGVFENDTVIAASLKTNIIATRRNDGTISLWNVANSKNPKLLTENFSEGIGEGDYATLSPNGEFLSIGKIGVFHSSIRIWDITNPKEPKEINSTLEIDEKVNCISFSKNGELLATGMAEGHILLWNLSDFNQNSNPIAHFSPEISVESFSLVFSDDGKTLASGRADGSIILWDLSNPESPAQVENTIKGNNSSVSSLIFLDSDKILASGNLDGTIIFWDLTSSTRHIINSEKLPDFRGFLSKIIISPDGDILIGGGNGGNLYRWDITNPFNPIYLESIKAYTSEVSLLEFNAESKILLSTDLVGNVLIWDMESNNYDLGEPTPLMGEIQSIAINPLQSYVVAGGAYGEIDTVRYYRGYQEDQDHFNKAKTHNTAVSSMIFNPSGTILLAGSSKGEISLQNVPPGEETKNQYQNPALFGTINSMILNSKGDTLITGTSSGIITLWNVTDISNSFRIDPPLTGHSKAITSLRLDEELQLLASGSADNSIRLWNASNLNSVVPFGDSLLGHTSPISSIAFTDDHKYLISGSPTEIIVWNLDTDYWEQLICQRTGRSLTENEWQNYHISDYKEYDERACIKPNDQKHDSIFAQLFRVEESVLDVSTSPLPKDACTQGIIFQSQRTGDTELLLFDETESFATPVNLSNSPAADSHPHRSPNNQFVVFQSNRGGNIELYVADIEGKAQNRLTNTNANNINAMVGPDNQSVIFQSDRNGNWDIWWIDAETGSERQLTTSAFDDVNPYWSPDKDWIVFQSDRSGTWNVYLLNVSTGTEYTVTDAPYDVVSPSWSPNGKQLAFLADWGGNWDLYVSDLQGVNVKRITEQGNAGNVAWSPDGKKIAYQLGDKGHNIFTYDLTSEQYYQLTDFEGPDIAPSWGCKGNYIAYASMQDGNSDIFIIPWMGGEPIRVTSHFSRDTLPLWFSNNSVGSLFSGSSYVR